MTKSQEIEFIKLVTSIGRDFIVICGILLIDKNLPKKRIMEIIKTYI